MTTHIFTLFNDANQVIISSLSVELTTKNKDSNTIESVAIQMCVAIIFFIFVVQIPLVENILRIHLHEFKCIASSTVDEQTKHKYN